MDSKAYKGYIFKNIECRLGTVIKECSGTNIDRLLLETESQITLIGEKKDEFKKLIRRIQVTKNRWFSEITSDCNGPIYKLINSCEIQYEQVKKNTISIEEFSSYFKVNNPIEYRAVITNDLEKWRCDDRCLLSDFQYFSTKNNKSKVAAIKNDIILLYYKMLEDENITMTPSVLSIFAFDPTNKATMFTEDDINSHKVKNLDTIQSYLYNDEMQQESLIVKLEKNTYLRNKQGQVAVDLVTQIALLKLMKYFNNIDRSVISYFFKLFSYKAILERRVITTLAEVTIGIGLSMNKRNRDAVSESLLKLGGMKLEYSNKGMNLRGALFEVYIDEKEENKKTSSQNVTVVCGSFLNDLMYMNSSYNFDTEVYEKINSTSQMYALWLQKRRFNSIISNKTEEEEIPFDMMTSPVRWNSSREDRKRIKILDTLNELKENQLIVKDYSYDKKTGRFKVVYIELPKEVIKGISSNSMNTGMFVDGKVLKLI